MCIVSMVSDHYRERFPTWPSEPWQPPKADTPTVVIGPTVDLGELRKLIDEFKEAIAAAQKLDALMRQPDCVDPVKAQLMQRVDWLERIVERLLPKPGEAATPPA